MVPITIMEMFMLALVYRIKLAFRSPFCQIWKIVKIYFSVLGALYTACILLSYLKENIDKVIFSSIWSWFVCLLLSFILSIKWRLSYTENVVGKDTRITLKTGCLEKEKNALIMSTNSSFITTMENSVINKDSAQGAFQNRFFKNNLSTLNTLITQGLEGESTVGSLVLNVDKKTYNVYPVGTVSKITFGKERHAYFFALNDVNQNGQNIQRKMDVVYDALNGLWTGILTKGHTDSEISIHLIASGRAGISEATRMKSFKIIVESFLMQVVNSGSKITDHLNIVVHPNDLPKFDFGEAVEFLKYKCKFMSTIGKKQNVGNGIS